MKEKIIEAAGKTWRFLGQNGQTNVSQLAKSLKEKDEVVLQALGWLAREDKIEYTVKNRRTFVSLVEGELRAFNSVVYHHEPSKTVTANQDKRSFLNRFICIHGHFYQPPRENPWLDEVEVQDSAYPYHDWNERVTAECYARNAAARILDNNRRIVDIVNNYSKISFNFGPTLLSWMQDKDPEIYAAVLEADRLSQQHFSGHGSAMAQVYNHMIMPLANTRDKRTQIIWGIKDFESRFKRKPEGMWLAETAVDLESLDLMAQQGIKFTVLAPHQAKRIKQGHQEMLWHDVSVAKVDPRVPYRCYLPSGTANLYFLL